MTGPLDMTITLTVEQVELIAQRVAEIVEARADDRTPSPWLSIEEAADLLRTSRARVDNLLSAGRLTRVKDGRRTLIERAEVERYLAGEPTGPNGRISRRAC